MTLTEKLTSILTDLEGIWTESVLILGAIILLFAGLIKGNSIIVKSIFAISILIAIWLNYSNEFAGLVLMESLLLSPTSSFFGSLFLVVTIFVLLFPRKEKHATEFYFFILAILIGSFFMLKANSLLIIYLSIELVSFASYILTNFSFKKESFEAGIKYLLFGAICSSFMLFGLGLVYGTTGVFSIFELAFFESFEVVTEVGFLMILIGVFFKISIVPSHIWVPATYQSAPADATAFMSIVPKLAGLILLKRFFSLPIFGYSQGWILDFALLLGILTIVIGTFGAFKQSNARRMISFGAIAHSGFLLPFAIIHSTTSTDSLWFYAVAYSLMNIAVFYLLDQYERREIVDVMDYKKSSNSVWLGTCFTLVLISLVGIPPMVGFLAKFLLFTTLWESYLIDESQIIVSYLVISVLATVGSLFYYLRIPKQIFLAKGETYQSINFNLSAKIIATLFSIGLLLLFFAPKLVIVMQQLLNNVHE